ncbi:hypothetical protein BDB00DRAFT_837268 [Zychaea mexicana]|uniref:uncharacterized protein n=1 Tax=Zychaea mexicana TaxID=64656 RepID=UPI0022FE554B|nr:uncharacterized protein BDB00DRAFT_837268 [Zychaea mexicana]KAI9490610.1 hypothetical protein BDB00DRAFT_837268 [Zychaea mexicana]
MDLSWCIICDRHCIEENLYCSTECANKDATCIQHTPQIPLTPLSPPSSPLLSYYGRYSHSSSKFTTTVSSPSYIPSPPNSPTLSFMDT